MGTTILWVISVIASGTMGWALGVRRTRGLHARHAEIMEAIQASRPREGVRLRAVRISR